MPAKASIDAFTIVITSFVYLLLAIRWLLVQVQSIVCKDSSRK